jgi:hypothetical protein
MRISLAVDKVDVYGLENFYIYGISKQFDICIEYLSRNGYSRARFDENITRLHCIIWILIVHISPYRRANKSNTIDLVLQNYPRIFNIFE